MHTLGDFGVTDKACADGPHRLVSDGDLRYIDSQLDTDACQVLSVTGAKSLQQSRLLHITRPTNFVGQCFDRGQGACVFDALYEQRTAPK
jgi:hypothetical protein